MPAIQHIWSKAFGYKLDDWQIDLLREITELKNGTLRWRQFLVSMGRQNGKTEIAAALGIWQLLSNSKALVIGIASSAEQARIVYQRTKQAIDDNPALVKRFQALTDTRGLRTTKGGRYEIKAAKGAALQGLPIDLGVIDEVHLLKQELWTALVNGTGGRDNCIVVGITTAGDQNSKLLKHLYELGQQGKIGFKVFEAPEARVPDDDETLGEYLTAANPAIAAGRISLVNVIEDVRSMPPTDAIRYRLNRFVAAQSNFITPELWARNVKDSPYPEGKSIVAIDIDPERRFASIARAIAVNGIIHTELIASIPNPSDEVLESMCRFVYKHASCYVMDGLYLKTLASKLIARGYPVKIMRAGDAMNAAAYVYGKLARQQVRHAGDPLLSMQIPFTIRKNKGDSFVIARTNTGVVIDSVMATVMAIYGTEAVETKRTTIHI